MIVAVGLLGGTGATAAEPNAQQDGAARLTSGNHWCETVSPARLRKQRAEAIARGTIAAPATRPLPHDEPVTAKRMGFPGGQACLSTAHIRLFEDSAGLLLTPHGLPQQEELMTQAANELLAEHGERYDFIGFWTNFDPAFRFGSAHYNPLFNDVSGIGDPSREGTPLFDDRFEIGLGSQRVEGYVMMYNVMDWPWGPGSNDGSFTRLALVAGRCTSRRSSTGGPCRGTTCAAPSPTGTRRSTVRARRCRSPSGSAPFPPARRRPSTVGTPTPAGSSATRICT
jgi:hypothetical protein